MPEEKPDEKKLKILLSVDNEKPGEEGGPTARSGFNYQDEIAVSCLLEMLETPSIVKVHCETHDDLLIVYQANEPAVRLAEFVQVKASEPDKLWSIADLCFRKEGKVGSSIYEVSLNRDKYIEESSFRIVTLRPVVSDLEMLTFPRGTVGREVDGKRFKIIQAELDKRFPGLNSAKSNGATYWLENCFWDQRYSEETVRQSNLLKLIRLSSKEKKLLLPELAEVLLEELRVWVKAAGAAKWEPDRDKKIISRESLRGWWERRIQELIEGATTLTGGKLKWKMVKAELPLELINLAIEMRRDYAAAVRTPRYMETDEAERLQRLVKSELISLRSQFFAGQLDLNGPEFHALCLAQMDKLNETRSGGAEDQSAYLKGCMYDITDRCLHRFERPT